MKSYIIASDEPIEEFGNWVHISDRDPIFYQLVVTEEKQREVLALTPGQWTLLGNDNTIITRIN